MYKWYLPTLGEIIQSTESSVIQQARQQRPYHQADQDWYGAIAALNTLLAAQVQANSEPLIDSIESAIRAIDISEDAAADIFEDARQGNNPIGGLIISGPFPVLTQTQLAHHFSHWTLTTDPAHRLVTPLQIPSAEAMAAMGCPHASSSPFPGPPSSSLPTLFLHPDDPLGVEPFCLVLTPNLSMVMTLGLDENHNPQFFMSYEPDTVWQGWRSLQSRLQVTHPSILPQLDQIANQFAPVAPDYRIVMEFSQLMLMHVSPEKRKSHGSRRRGQSTSCNTRFRSTDQVTAQVEHQSAHQSAYQSSHQSVYQSSHQSTNQGLNPIAKPPSGTQEDHKSLGLGRSRYPRKPLNRNRTERLKLDTVSWREVVKSEASNTASPSSTNQSGTNQSGTNQSRAAWSKHTDQPTALNAGDTSSNEVPQPEIGSDIELLKAIAHEVRTPLTTIRTLTRLLLRRKGLEPKVIQRLQQIDRECTKQIDRFSLIFKAVELKTTAVDQPASPLATMSLAQVVQQNVSRWEHQAQQRNLTLDVVLPQTLPNVMSDPTMLDQVLTGLMDRMTHTLPAGTQIQLSAVPAGHQLKLQFWAKPNACSEMPSGVAGKISPSSTTSVDSPLDECNLDDSPSVTASGLNSIFAPTLQSVGQLLMFQPETGNLSLNLDMTKNLFQALGGKLIVRHTPQKGEVLTIFLPMEQDTSGELANQILQGKRFC